jgi:O-antigen ligase
VIPARTMKTLPRVLFLCACVLLLGVLAGALVTEASIFEEDFDLYMAMGVVVVAFTGFAILLEWRLGAFLLGAVLPFEDLLTFGFIGSGIKAIALVTLSSIGFRLLLDRRLYAKLWHLLQQPLVLTLLALVCWSTVSISWATYREAALVKTSTFLGLFSLVLIIGLLKERELKLLWAIVALSTVLTVPLGYVLPAPTEDIAASGQYTSGRFTSGGLNPNDYGGLLVIVFFVTYYMLSKRFPVAKYVLALPIFFGLLASESRTALVVLLATPLLMLWVPGVSKRSMKSLLITYCLLGLVFAGTIYVVPALGETILARYASLSQLQSEETWAGRWELWDAAFRMILSHPLLGVGVGTFPYIAPTYSSFAEFMNSTLGEGAATTHNIFLSMASELGLVGLALFLGVLFLAFRQALALVDRGSAVGVGLLFGLVAYTLMSLTTSWETQKIGYFLLGSILALYSLRPTQNTIPKPEEGEWRQW